MKIALTSEFFPHSSECEIRGGVEARAYHVARHLAKKHDVSVYTIKETGLDDESEFDGMRVVRIKPEVEYSQAASLSKRFLFMLNGLKEIKTDQYDLVDGTSFMTYPLAWHSNISKKVATYHDVWINSWIKNVGVAGIMGEILERYVLSKDWDRLIAVSNYTRDNLIRYGVGEEKVIVIHNGVDVTMAESLRIEKVSEPTISCVSRLVKYKQVDVLIRALAEVRKTIPEARLVIVGTGPEEVVLKKLAVKLGLKDNIVFKGFVPRYEDVLKIMKSSHMACMPSIVEGFGIIIAEAMALKIPYVASDIPAFREASRNGSGGLLFKPGDVKELSEKIVDVLSGKVTGGVSFISEYDWGNVAQKVAEVYQGVLDDG